MKKRRLVLTTLLAALAINMVNAQYTPPQGYNSGQHPVSASQPAMYPSGYFEISIGITEPVGPFRNNFGTSYGGYALPGIAFDLSMGIPVNHSNMGIALMYGGSANTFDVNSYVSSLQASDQSRAYAAQVQDTYNTRFIMGGYFWTWPADRLSFDGRVMIGAALCTLPEVGYTATQYNPVFNTNDVYSYDIYSSSSAAFAFDIGGDLRYRFRRTSLMLGMDYAFADPYVNTTEQAIDPAGNYSYSRVTGNIPISLFSFNLGIGYQIGGQQ